MGLRDRLKKMKNRPGSTTPSGNTTPKAEYYKPGEEPKLKYRGKIDKEHTDKLHAFSFSDAWSRRKSNVSDGHGTMSPGGTKALSRATSVIGSMRKKSVASGSGSDTEGRDARRKSAAAPPETETLKENEVDDTNVANTGISRPQTANGKPRDSAYTVSSNVVPGAPLEKSETQDPSAAHDAPFSTEELQKALSRATIEAPGGVARAGEIEAH